MPEAAALLVIVGVAVWLRFPTWPPFRPTCTATRSRLASTRASSCPGNMPAVFAIGWYDVPALSFTLHAATMRVFGDNLFGLRMASVIEGVALDCPAVPAGRRLWGPRPALLAAAFMAVAAWHIQFSRTGFHYMQAPVATLLALYFLVRGRAGPTRAGLGAVRPGDRPELRGLLRGPAGAGLLVAVYLGYRALTERGFLRTHARALLALVFGAVVFLAPMAVVFVRSPEQFQCPRRAAC